MRAILNLGVLAVVASGCASTPKVTAEGPSEMKFPKRVLVNEKGDVVVETEWVTLWSRETLASRMPRQIPFEAIKPDGTTAAGPIAWNRTNQVVGSLPMIIVRDVRLDASGEYRAEYDTHTLGMPADGGPYAPGAYTMVSLPKTVPVYYGGELIPRRRALVCGGVH